MSYLALLLHAEITIVHNYWLLPPMESSRVERSSFPGKPVRLTTLEDTADFLGTAALVLFAAYRRIWPSLTSSL